jgi:DNA (cytosine-5)-methyltransferase 1
LYRNFKKNRPLWVTLGLDIQKLSEAKVNSYLDYKADEIDLLSGGYPCQEFSYADKKMGPDDVRGALFYNYAQILLETKPKMFLVENVKGLASHDNGNTLKTMIDIFKNGDYEVQFKVLNAWDYNVAQKRERVVIIGVRCDIHKKIGFDFEFPEKHLSKPVLRDALLNVPESEFSPYPRQFWISSSCMLSIHR